MLDVLEHVAILRPVSPDALVRLAVKGRPQHFAAGSALMSQGEASECLYVIHQGRVRVVRRHIDGSGWPLVLAELGPGEIVGEMGVLDNAPRSATVIAMTEVDVLQLDADVLTEAMVYHRDLAEALLHVVSERLRGTDDLVARMFAHELSRHPIFRPIPRAGLEFLARRGKWQHFEPGAVLMAQSEPSQTMYLIREGSVRVERTLPNRADAVVLAELGPGEVVGEMGLLDDAPRTATVTAIEAVDALELDGRELAETMLRHPEVCNALLHVMSSRLRSADALAEQLAPRDPSA